MTQHSLRAAAAALALCAVTARPLTDIESHARITDSAAAGSFTYIPLKDPSAVCLDGSQYGIFVCTPAGATDWQINIQGGGWCVPRPRHHLRRAAGKSQRAATRHDPLSSPALPSPLRRCYNEADCLG